MSKPTTSVTTTTPLVDKDFFMAIAVLAAQRSKDPRFQVGACIVNTFGAIVGIGYNGFCYNWSKNDPKTPWGKEEKHGIHSCHAEVNAITFRNSEDVKDCTIYQTLAPCNDCAKYIVESKIKKVYYLSDEKSKKAEFILGKDILKAAKIKHNTYHYSNKASLPSFINDFKIITTKKQVKREAVLKPFDFFKHAAILSSKRSQDSEIYKTGVTIQEIDTGIFLGCGHSCLPYGYTKWCDDARCHAIVHALISNNIRNKKCKIYSTHFPCNKCVQSILQHNIEVVDFQNRIQYEIQVPKIKESMHMISKSDKPHLLSNIWHCSYHPICELNFEI